MPYCEDLADPTALSKDDIIILIMGVTRTGKSNLIDLLVDQPGRRAGSSMKSCTSEVGATRIVDHPQYGSRIVLVDTPGFNDSEKTDLEILEIISTWLVAMDQKHMPIRSILYLHRISDNRLNGSQVRNFQAFKALCGECNAPNVILVSTMWDNIHGGEGLKNENDLMQYWETWITRGTKTAHFYNTSESAWNIILKHLESTTTPIIRLNLQKEMSKAYSCVYETEAGKVIVQAMNLSLSKLVDSSVIKPINTGMTRSLKRRTGETFRERGHQKEIIILVMGATSAGKSTFINALLKGHPDQKVLSVGHKLSSCTSEIEERTLVFHKYEALRDYRITLVDTPGFDDTHETDLVILKRIATWLKEAYCQQRVLGGIIYLHDVSHNRFSGTCRKNLNLFAKMCGTETFGKVIIGTTHWNQVNQAVRESRTADLRQGHWKEMLEKGCRTMTFTDSYDSAISFLERLTSHISEDIFMQIQRELVDEKKILLETAAARELLSALEIMYQLKKEAAALEEKLAKGGTPEDRERLKQTKKARKALLSQIEGSKTPFSRKLEKFFGLV